MRPSPAAASPAQNAQRSKGAGARQTTRKISAWGDILLPSRRALGQKAENANYNIYIYIYIYIYIWQRFHNSLVCVWGGGGKELIE